MSWDGPIARLSPHEGPTQPIRAVVPLQPCGKAQGIPDTALTSYEPEPEIGSKLSAIQKAWSIDLFSKRTNILPVSSILMQLWILQGNFVPALSQSPQCLRKNSSAEQSAFSFPWSLQPHLCQTRPKIHYCIHNRNAKNIPNTGKRGESQSRMMTRHATIASPSILTW